MSCAICCAAKREPSLADGKILVGIFSNESRRSMDLVEGIMLGVNSKDKRYEFLKKLRKRDVFENEC
jgi:hypothetical protein